jgi:phage FluMu protein Com
MECMKRIECPMCGGRAFDISKMPREQIQVEIKCPKCRNIVTINITSSHKISKLKRN